VQNQSGIKIDKIEQREREREGEGGREIYAWLVKSAMPAAYKVLAKVFAIKMGPRMEYNNN